MNTQCTKKPELNALHVNGLDAWCMPAVVVCSCQLPGYRRELAQEELQKHFGAPCLKGRLCLLVNGCSQICIVCAMVHLYAGRFDVPSARGPTSRRHLVTVAVTNPRPGSCRSILLS